MNASVDPDDITVYAGQNVTLNVTCVEAWRMNRTWFKLDEFGAVGPVFKGKTKSFTFTVEKIGEYPFTAGDMKGVLRVVPKPEK